MKTIKPIETMEENKLISEFMGYKTYEHTDSVAITLTEDNGFSTDYGHVHTKYHTSWDWLMPVVEKIENHLGYAVTIVQNSCYTESMGGEERDSKLEATYKTVVEFIKYYNKPK